MDKDVAVVVNGFLNLTRPQQQAAADLVLRMLRGEEGTVRFNVEREMKSIDLGPLGVGCKCCGK